MHKLNIYIIFGGITNFFLVHFIEKGRFVKMSGHVRVLVNKSTCSIYRICANVRKLEGAENLSANTYDNKNKPRLYLFTFPCITTQHQC